MYRYIARANIDHYLRLLNDPDISPKTRATITKLLIDEEGKLEDDLEQLAFFESRAARGRDRLNNLRSSHQSLADESPDRARADRLLASLEATQQLLEGFCHRRRERISSGDA